MFVVKSIVIQINGLCYGSINKVQLHDLPHAVKQFVMKCEVKGIGFLQEFIIIEFEESGSIESLSDYDLTLLLEIICCHVEA